MKIICEIKLNFSVWKFIDQVTSLQISVNLVQQTSIMIMTICKVKLKCYVTTCKI